MDDKKIRNTLFIGIICFIAGIVWMVLSNGSPAFYLILTSIGAWDITEAIVKMKRKN